MDIKKILVVGGSGQLGKALLKVLQNSFDVFGTYHQNFSEGLIHLDITDKEEVERIIASIKPNLIINAVAMMPADKCETFPEMAEKIHVKGNENLIGACSRLGSKLIFISSYYVFDGEKGYYAESDLPHPLNIYGLTKLRGEQSTLQQRNNLVIRVSKIYSLGYDDRNFLARTIHDFKQGAKITVTNDQFNNPISADDLSLAIKKLIEIDAAGIYHVGGPDYLSNYEFALIIAKYFRFDKKLVVPQSSEQFKSVAKRPKNCALSIEKLINKTGYKPNSIEKNISQLKDDQTGIYTATG